MRANAVDVPSPSTSAGHPTVAATVTSTDPEQQGLLVTSKELGL